MQWTRCYNRLADLERSGAAGGDLVKWLIRRELNETPTLASPTSSPQEVNNSVEMTEKWSAASASIASATAITDVQTYIVAITSEFARITTRRHERWVMDAINRQKRREDRRFRSANIEKLQSMRVHSETANERRNQQIRDEWRLMPREEAHVEPPDTTARVSFVVLAEAVCLVSEYCRKKSVPLTDRTMTALVACSVAIIMAETYDIQRIQHRSFGLPQDTMTELLLSMWEVAAQLSSSQCVRLHQWLGRLYVDVPTFRR